MLKNLHSRTTLRSLSILLSIGLIGPSQAASPNEILKVVREAQAKRMWLKHHADGRVVAWPMTFEKLARGFFNFDVKAASGNENIELWCKLPITDTNQAVVETLSKGQHFVCKGTMRALGGISTSTTVVIEGATIEPTGPAVSTPEMTQTRGDPLMPLQDWTTLADQNRRKVVRKVVDRFKMLPAHRNRNSVEMDRYIYKCVSVMADEMRGERFRKLKFSDAASICAVQMLRSR